MENTYNDIVNRRVFLNKISKIGIATLATPYLLKQAFSEENKKKTILIVGDSTTYNQMGYSGILKDYIGDSANVNMQRIGTAPDGLGIESWDIIGYGILIFDKLKSIKPDIYQINQGIHCISWMDKLSEEDKKNRLETFKKNLKIYIKKVKSELPYCKFVWATSLPTDECVVSLEKPELGCVRKNENVIIYNQAAMEICNSEKVVINDLYLFAINNNLKRLSDGTHYTAESNSILGKNVAEFLSPHVNNSENEKRNYFNRKNIYNVKYLYQDNSSLYIYVNSNNIKYANIFNIEGKRIETDYQYDENLLKIMKKKLLPGFYKLLIKIEKTVNEIHFIAN